jgi:Glutathione S-transferase
VDQSLYLVLLPAGQVIEESLDIMCWALRLNDPQHWLTAWQQNEIQTLIHWNDGEFKHYLDRYKYADRYPEHPQQYYRHQGELFLTELEQRLQQTSYLAGAQFSIADAAIAPFIRQFAAVDSEWFASNRYHALRKWLQEFLDSTLFQSVMQQYLPWVPDTDEAIFADTVSSRDK